MKEQTQQVSVEQITINRMSQRLGNALAQVSALETQLDILYNELDKVKKENDELKEKKSKKKGE